MFQTLVGVVTVKAGFVIGLIGSNSTTVDIGPELSRLFNTFLNLAGLVILTYMGKRQKDAITLLESVTSRDAEGNAKGVTVGGVHGVE